MALNSPSRPGRRLHRKRLTILVDGRATQVPEPPRGLNASRLSAWNSYWRSPAGAASASDVNHIDAVYRLWGQYQQYDRVAAAVASKPILSVGSMGQERLSPLASREAELLRRIESGERKAGIGGVANQRKVPEVEVDPITVFARMFAAIDVPRLDDPEFGGTDPRTFFYGDPTEDDIEREAASLLREGKQLGPGGPHDPLPDLIRERGIDPVRLMARARVRNRANERRLLTEWQRLLDDAQQGQVPGEGWSRLAHVTGATREHYRQALVDLLEVAIDEATERGVLFAQAPLWRRTELDASALAG